MTKDQIVFHLENGIDAFGDQMTPEAREYFEGVVSAIRQPDTYTIAEAARHKGVSAQAVRDALRVGKFPNAWQDGKPGRGIWYLPVDEVEAWQPRAYRDRQ